MSEGAVTSSRGRLIALGEIVDTHGVGELLRFHPYSNPSAALAAARTVFLAPRAAARAAAHAPASAARSRQGVGADAASPARPMALLSARPHGRVFLLKLAGIETHEAARDLVGTVLSVAEADLPAPDPGEFYAYQLEGLEVVTMGGDRLGTVASLFPTGSNEVLVVRDGQREYLIPVIADVIRTIDLAAGRVVIEPLAGLLG